MEGSTGIIGTVTIGTSLSYSGTTLNTIQDIRTSATPTFAGLSILSSSTPTVNIGVPAGYNAASPRLYIYSENASSNYYGYIFQVLNESSTSRLKITFDNVGTPTDILYIGSTGTFYPVTTNTGSIGLSTNRFTSLYLENTYDMSLTLTSGTIMNLAFGAATTLTGAVTGLNLDLNTNVTAATLANVIGYQLKTPAFTQTSANTTSYYGFYLPTAGALSQTTAAGTINFSGLNLVLPQSSTNTASTAATINVYGINITSGTATTNASANVLSWYGANITMPNITQTAGTLTSYGLYLAAGTVTTGGNQYAIYITGSSITPFIIDVTTSTMRNVASTQEIYFQGGASFLGGAGASIEIQGTDYGGAVGSKVGGGINMATANNSGANQNINLNAWGGVINFMHNNSNVIQIGNNYIEYLITGNQFLYCNFGGGSGSSNGSYLTWNDSANGSANVLGLTTINGVTISTNYVLSYGALHAASDIRLKPDFTDYTNDILQELANIRFGQYSQWYDYTNKKIMQLNRINAAVDANTLPVTIRSKAMDGYMGIDHPHIESWLIGVSQALYTNQLAQKDEITHLKERITQLEQQVAYLSKKV